jgi:hypothetical protein
MAEAPHPDRRSPPVAAVYDRRPRLTDRHGNSPAVIDRRYNNMLSGPTIGRSACLQAMVCSGTDT